MNRILSITILLLTLLTAAEVSAQSYYNEEYSDCDETDYGQGTVVLPCFEICRSQCSSCEGFFDCDEIAEHEKGCYYECPRCNQRMTIMEMLSHYCEPKEPDSDDPDFPDDNDDDRNSPNQDRVVCALCGAVMTYMESLTHNCRRLNVNGNYNGSLWYLLQPVISSGRNSSNNNNNNESGFGPAEEQPLHAAQQSGEKTDSIGYHRCPCMITEATKKILDNLKEHRLYNQDNGYPNLTKDLERQLAFPEIIQQGQNGTCGPAFIQKYLAENYPKQYADCVYNLANYGYYGPWGLELAMDVNEYSPIGMTANDILHENGNEDLQDERIGNGIQYTSVDALMQSAIQTWANTDSWLDKLKCLIGRKQPGYDPRLDNGKGGGMDYKEMKDFFENIVGESAILHKQEGYMDYDYINEKITDITNNEFDSFTILAGVKIKRTDRGYYFDNKGENHYVEITGLHSGKIDFWSWGQDYTTSQYNCPIEELMIINKTDHAKKEKQEKKSLTCNCPNCTSDGCSKCVQK